MPEIILRKLFLQYQQSTLNVFRMEDFQFQKNGEVVFVQTGANMVDVPTLVFISLPNIDSYQTCSGERHICMM
jgi:hypothetical protein